MCKELRYPEEIKSEAITRRVMADALSRRLTAEKLQTISGTDNMKAEEGKQADRKFYLDMLTSDECLCGRNKQPRRTFCYRCFKALPHDMQIELYKRMGAGYEEAVEAASAWLQTEVW